MKQCRPADPPRVANRLRSPYYHALCFTGASMTQLPDLYYYRPSARQQNPQTIDADIVIYGATSAGVAAAVAAARLGKKAVIAEFGQHVGGLTSGGLGATDIGNKAAIGGISREFYKRLGKHYGVDESWTFEPSV